MSNEKVIKYLYTLFIKEGQEGICSVVRNTNNMEELHTHNYFEFFLVTKGTAQHFVNNKLVPLKKGTLVFVKPNTIHCYREASPDFQIFNILLTNELCKRIFSFLSGYTTLEITTNSNNVIHKQLSDEFFYPICSKLQHLMVYPKENSNSYNTALILIVADLISCFYFESFNFDTPELPEWLTKLLIDYRKIENYSKDISNLYSKANCTKEYLSRVFKIYLKKTPTQYISELRLERAAKELIYSNTSILEISDEVGYNNLSHFYHQFKNRYDMSPLKYRAYSRQETK